MSVQYTNRKDKTYYLHQGKAKAGKSRYYFSQKKEGNLIESIPTGYEIYENPNAQVYLTKTKLKIIADREVTVVKRAVAKYAKLKHFFAEARGKNIVVYLPIQNVEAIKAIFSQFGVAESRKFNDRLEKEIQFSPIMRFALIDKNDRTYACERWCSRGSIDDWIHLESSNNLSALTEKHCFHLGKDSFYDLMGV